MAGHAVNGRTSNMKGKADAARGKVFSKIAKEIMVAASHGGGNPDDNIQLRALIQKAKASPCQKTILSDRLKREQVN